MPFLLWYGLAETEAEFSAKKLLWRAVIADTLDEALWIAMKVHEEGAEISWEIEGEDGSRFDRKQIATLVQERKGELSANPLGKFEWRRRIPPRT